MSENSVYIMNCSIFQVIVHKNTVTMCKSKRNWELSWATQ